MACKTSCKLCKRLVISQAVAYDSGVLTITIPAGSYMDGEKYCIVIAQAIPATAIIGAPILIQIGTGTVLYPLTRCDCSQATTCDIKTRTRYATRVVTNSSGGSFKLLSKTCGYSNNLPSIDGN